MLIQEHVLLGKITMTIPAWLLEMILLNPPV